MAHWNQWTKLLWHFLILFGRLHRLCCLLCSIFAHTKYLDTLKLKTFSPMVYRVRFHMFSDEMKKWAKTCSQTNIYSYLRTMNVLCKVCQVPCQMNSKRFVCVWFPLWFGVWISEIEYKTWFHQITRFHRRMLVI